MPTPDAVRSHYRAQLRQAEATTILARRSWAKVRLTDLDGSWSAVAARMTAVVAAGQLGAARAGAAYVPQVTAVDPVAAVVPEALAGVASDGRGLESLLYGAVVHVKDAVSRSQDNPLDVGRRWIDLLVRTQVADAGRGAAGIAIAATPGMGWVRMVSPPCCSRCAVLAGKFFRYNDGFQRHPGCDCRHVPCTRSDADAFQSSVPLEQVRDLSAAERKAVSDGADLAQVVNARRGSDGMTTTEGTTRRTFPGQRLTPDAIYKVSATRDEAIRRLRENGYLN